MHLPVTALYASILALIIVVLGMNVTAHRVKLKVSVGDGGNARMLRMIRVHGNAAEYLPLAVLLMGIYELDGGARTLIHTAGLAQIAGRVLLTIGLWGPAQPNPVRGVGAVITWLVLIALAGLNLWQIG